MSIETKYVCDVCGATRGETNHWFWVEPLSDEAGVATGGMAIQPWGSGPANILCLHLCGQQCAHALLDQFLTPKAA